MSEAKFQRRFRFETETLAREYAEKCGHEGDLSLTVVQRGDESWWVVTPDFKDRIVAEYERGQEKKIGE